MTVRAPCDFGEEDGVGREFVQILCDLRECTRDSHRRVIRTYQKTVDVRPVTSVTCLASNLLSASRQTSLTIIPVRQSTEEVIVSGILVAMKFIKMHASRFKKAEGEGRRIACHSV